MTTRPKFKFKPEGNGWIEITIEHDEKTLRNVVSDVPNDAIGSLVEVMIRLSKGSKNEKMEWPLEPDYWIWQFHRDGTNISLVVELNNSREIIQSTENAIMHELFHALRLLESNMQENMWSWDFPNENLNELEQSLKRQ